MKLHDGPKLQLRERDWAMRVLGYQPHQRSAFWNFAYANHLPHVRVGKKRIMFNEVAVYDWVERRSSSSGAR